jgi:hypothetical protein
MLGMSQPRSRGSLQDFAGDYSMPYSVFVGEFGIVAGEARSATRGERRNP